MTRLVWSILVVGALVASADAVAQRAAEAPRPPETAELATPRPEIIGVWELLESSSQWASLDDAWVEITPAYWVAAADGRLQYRAPLHGVVGDELEISLFGNRQRRRLELEGEELKVRFTETKTRFRPEPKEITERYRRGHDRPPSLDVAKVLLGDPAAELAPERLDAIGSELVERGRVDQEVREVYATPGAQPSQEDREKMRQADRSNTAYLLDVIAEVGWIDADRFGAEAARSAWLIVQHSPDLRLKWTVLSELERRRQETGVADGRFALLWDRTQISLGHKQRYGSQIFYGPDGMFVPPLEDPERVDELRAGVGLGPLAEYLERFRERNDGQPVPVREAY